MDRCPVASRLMAELLYCFFSNGKQWTRLLFFFPRKTTFEKELIESIHLCVTMIQRAVGHLMTFRMFFPIYILLISTCTLANFRDPQKSNIYSPLSQVSPE